MKAREKALLTTTLTALALFFVLFAISCLGHFLHGSAPASISLADSLNTRVFTEAAVLEPQQLSKSTSFSTSGTPNTASYFPTQAQTLPETASEVAQISTQKVCNKNIDTNSYAQNHTTVTLPKCN